MSGLPSLYPFCVSGLTYKDMQGGVIFDGNGGVTVILDGADLGVSAKILTKSVFTLAAPNYVCTSKLLAVGENAIAWEITPANGQYNHRFTRHDTRPGYVDGKSSTMLPPEVVGRDLEGAYTALLAALPKLAVRSKAEADKIMAGLRPTLSALGLTQLL